MAVEYKQQERLHNLDLSKIIWCKPILLLVVKKSGYMSIGDTRRENIPDIHLFGYREQKMRSLWSVKVRGNHSLITFK
jgi:hypothetical protein